MWLKLINFNLIMRIKGMSGFKSHDKFNQLNEGFLSGYSEGGGDDSIIFE